MILKVIFFFIFIVIKSFIFIVNKSSSKLFVINKLRIVIKLRIWIISFDFILLMTKNTFFYFSDFRWLIIKFDFVLNFFLDNLNWSSFDWEKLKELFDGNKLWSSFFNSYESLLECFHRNVSRFRVISFTSDKRIFLNLKNFINENFSYEIVSIEILLPFVNFRNGTTNDFINSLWNVCKSYFIFIFQTLNKSKNIITTTI